jgi:hypothetical protein
MPEVDIEWGVPKTSDEDAKAEARGETSPHQK